MTAVTYPTTATILEWRPPASTRGRLQVIPMSCSHDDETRVSLLHRCLRIAKLAATTIAALVGAAKTLGLL